MPGYTGVNCSSSCPYPYYGVDCQRTCKCSRDKCDVSTGCNSLTTGKQFENKNTFKNHKTRNLMVQVINIFVY